MLHKRSAMTFAQRLLNSMVKMTMFICLLNTRRQYRFPSW